MNPDPQTVAMQQISNIADYHIITIHVKIYGCSTMGNEICCHQEPLPSIDIDNYAINLVTDKVELSQQIKDILDSKKPFQDEIPNKLMRIKYRSDIYEGELDHNKLPDGFGRLYKTCGSCYVGQFNKGQVEGRGFYAHPDGTYYQGKFRNNGAEDSNAQYVHNKYHYEGGFKESKFHGKGRQETSNYSFEGDYDNNCRVKGTLTWKQNGEPYRYIGSFCSNNRFSGKAKLQEPTGIFVGEFVKGQKHGQGEYTFKSGLKYIGQYRQGFKHGKGTIYNFDKSKSYEGQWEQGLPNGRGITYRLDGKQIESEFIEGIDVRFLSQQERQNLLQNKQKRHNQIIQQQRRASYVSDGVEIV